jgi:hypothetical protein
MAKALVHEYAAFVQAQGAAYVTRRVKRRRGP